MSLLILRYLGCDPFTGNGCDADTDRKYGNVYDQLDTPEGTERHIPQPHDEGPWPGDDREMVGIGKTMREVGLARGCADPNDHERSMACGELKNDFPNTYDELVKEFEKRELPLPPLPELAKPAAPTPPSTVAPTSPPPAVELTPLKPHPDYPELVPGLDYLGPEEFEDEGENTFIPLPKFD